MLNAPLARVFRRMVSRVAGPECRSRRTVLEVSQNSLEPRYAPAALAAPTVDSTVVQYQRQGPPANTILDYVNPSSAADPSNPNRQVFFVEQYSNSATDGIRSFILGKSTIDGGATWTQFTKFGGGNASPEALVFRDPEVPETAAPAQLYFREYSTPSTTVTRDGQVYVSFVAHNAGHSAGVVGVRRYDFSGTSLTPALASITNGQELDLNPFAPPVSSTNAIYKWAFGVDEVYNPVIASNANPLSYTDPDTGLTFADPGGGSTTQGGNIFVAFSSDYVRPGPFGGSFNPNVIQVMGSSGVVGNQGKVFTGPLQVSGSFFADPQFGASRPSLAVTGLNSTANGAIAPGQLVTAYQQNGANNKEVGVDVSPVTGVTLGGINRAVANITDATGTATPYVVGVTNYPVVVGGPTVDSTFTLADINLTLGLRHPDVSQLKIELVAPTGASVVLLNARTNNLGTTEVVEPPTGITPGLTGQDLGYKNGVYYGTTFSDNAPRRISDPTNTAPFIGTFFPDVRGAQVNLQAGNALLSAFKALTPAQLTGTWNIRVSDQTAGPNPIPAGQATQIGLGQLGLAFGPANRGMRQSVLDASANRTIAVAGRTVPTPNGARALIPLQGGLTGNPFVPSGNVPYGIGSTPSVAVDLSLGQNQSPTNPSPVAGVFSGRVYVGLAAGVDLNLSATLDANDDVDVFVASFDSTVAGGPVSFAKLNTDSQKDNVSQGLRYQFNPRLAVDSATGTLAATWQDARFDAANARYVPMLSTSIDGGATFSPQVSLAQARVATDVITGKELTVEPLPTNYGTYVPGNSFTSPAINDLEFANGRVVAHFVGNPNAPGSYAYTALARTAAGPQVIFSDVGAIGGTLTTDVPGNTAIAATRVQLDNPIAPTPPRFYQYNASRASGLAGVADGTLLLDGIRVVFDRRMDPTSFTPDDVRVFFQGTAGGSPVELRTLYPGLSYRIDNLSAQTAGVTANNPTTPVPLAGANIVTADTDFVIRFVDANDPTALFPVGRVGTYSYQLSPYIRDRIRNISAGTTPTGQQVTPATIDTATGKLIEPVTVRSSNANPVPLESRGYQQPALPQPNPVTGKYATLPTAPPIYANEADPTVALTNNLSLAVIPPKTYTRTDGVTFTAQGVPAPGAGNVVVDGVTDVPVTFPADAFPAGSNAIARALVQIDLVHTRRAPNTSVYDGLIVQLISPGGTVIPLVVQTGGNGAEYDGFAFENTVFDSQAARSLQLGNARFQGSYRTYGLTTTTTPGGTTPLPDLNTLLGTNPAGTWFLRIIDNYNQDNQYGTSGQSTASPLGTAQQNPLGYLRSWSLTVVPGTVTAPGYGPAGSDPASVILRANNLRRGNLLDQDADGSTWEPLEDSLRAPTSVAPLTLTGGPFQAGGKGVFEQGPFNKSSLPLVIGGPRVLGVATRDSDPRNLSDQVYVNRPATSLIVRFDRAVNVGSINPNSLRILGPSGLLAGPFTVAAGATPDEVVIGFASSVGGSFTRGGSYTVQFDANIASTVGDLVDVNQNAGVDRLFGGNATTSTIQSVTFAGVTGPTTVIRSAPVVAGAGGQAVTGESVAEIQIPFAEAFQIAQDLQRFPNERLRLTLAIRDNNPSATPALFSGLTADLVAPDGTRIRLFTSSLNSQSGPGSVTTQIVFDDAALTPAGGGINPFQAAPYNPQQPLARLLGRWSQGTWKVVVSNTLFRIDPVTLQAVDLGQILSASLTLTRAAVTTGTGEARADETTLGFRVFNQDPTSKESNQIWQAVGAAPSNNQANVGRVSAVTIDTADPTGNTVFAAGASGGVWRTTNFLTTDPDGPSWVPLTDSGPSTALNIASIAVFPRNNDPQQTVVFAQTGEGNAANLPNGNTPWTRAGVGVIRSFDGGQSWSLLDSTVNSVTAANRLSTEPVEAIGRVLDINDPRRDHRFVGASGFRVIVDPTPYQTDVIAPIDPNRLPPNNLAVYMAVSDSRAAGDASFAGGVWRSLDSGRTWTRIIFGNATDVAFAPGSVGADGSLQTVYAAVVGAGGVAGGVYITRQATNVPSAGTGTGGFTRLNGGGGNNVIRDQLAGQNRAVGVAAPALSAPGTGNTRYTLATPAPTNNPLANAIYQGWLYALASNSDGSVDGLFLTKDFGNNWTRVVLPELVDAFGDFWGHNDEFQAQVPKNLVDFNTTSQFTGNVAYTRDASPAAIDPVTGLPSGLLTDSPRTYIPRPGGAFSLYGTTPRAAGQGTPGQDQSGGTGNRALSLAVDPLNPGVLYLGGDRSIRVDTGVIKDAQSFYYYENTDNFTRTLLNSKANGGVTQPQAPLMANAQTGAPYPLENGLPTVTGFQWGVIVPGLANNVDTANGIAPVYRDKYGLPSGFVNLSKDPGNPFLNPSVIGVYNAGTFNNTGENAQIRPFDNILFGSYDVTSIVPFVDPQTGKTRLIYGTANGIYTGVDTSAASGPSLDTAIGDSGFVTNPTQISKVVTGPRNGNLQIGQYYQGAVQPSRLAADIAGALFYAVSQDNGFPVSTAGVVESGSPAQRTTDWPGTGLNVGVDSTGTGNAYQYRLPSSTGTDTSNTAPGNPADFFRLLVPGSDQGASGIGRTNNLLVGQDPFNNAGDFPLNDTRYGEFAVNPIDGAGLVISAAPSTAGTGGSARVFRSVDRGLTWQNLGAPAGAGQYVSALAFGGPDTRFPTQRNNFIFAGTGDSTAGGYSTGGSNGQLFITTTGTTNSWVRVPGDSATGGRSILQIVPNPRFSSAQAFNSGESTNPSDLYVVTDRQVFHVVLFSGTTGTGGRVPLDRDNPGGVQALWTDVTAGLYDVVRPIDSYSRGAGGEVQTAPALRDPAGRQLDLTSLAVDWRYTNPVLYVGGDGGVFRSVTFNPANPGAAGNTATWTLFPDNPLVAGQYQDGGYLPNARITDLDLSLGVLESTYDSANPGRGGLPVVGIDPSTGLPRSGGSLNLLLATTFGRGQFVTRINPADAALNTPVNPVRADAFVSGPRVSTVANPNPVGGPSSKLVVVFDSSVDPVTLDPTDITLLDTSGSPLIVTAVTPVPGVPGQPDPRNRYTITFTEQDGTPADDIGFYFLQVGSSKDLTISDLAGNRMNQNGNLINGETFASPNGDDTFSTFIFLNGQSKSLLVSGLPSKVSTSAPVTFTVTAVNADGSRDTSFAGPVTLTSTDDNVLLSATGGIPTAGEPLTYTFTSADAGLKQFTATFRTGAAITTPTGALLAPVTDLVGLFQTVLVDALAPAYNDGQVGAQVFNARVELAPADLPAAVSTYDPRTLTANVVDFNGNRLPAFAGVVALSSSDPNAVLPAAETYVPGASNGSAQFKGVIFRSNNTRTLTYTARAVDGLDPLTVDTAVSNAVLDVTGFFAVNGTPTTSTYDPQNLLVTVRSALTGAALPAFNTGTGVQSKVSVTTSDPLASITPTPILFPAGSEGKGATEVLFRTAGSPTHSLVFASPLGVDSKTLTATVVNAVFRVTDAAGAVFAPAQLSTWNPQPLTVAVTTPVAGRNNATLPRFTGEVTVTSSDPLAAAVRPDSDPANPLVTVPAAGLKYAYTDGDRVQTLLFRTGSDFTGPASGTPQTLTFTTPTGVDSGTVGTKVVNAVFAVTGLPATGQSAQAGKALDLIVSIADPLNNNATLPAFQGTVDLGTNDTKATLQPDPFTYTPANNGTKAFVATFKTAGTKTFTADTPVGVTPFRGSLLVSAATATRLSIGGFPTPVVAGTPGAFTVAAFDEFDNVASGFTGTVNLSTSDAKAVGLPATYTFTAADAGSKQFTAELRTAGTQQLVATQVGGAGLSASQTGILVTPAAAVAFSLDGYPTTTVAGTPNALVLRASDRFGNTATDFTGTVTFTSSDPLAGPNNPLGLPSGLPAPYTFTAADQGAKTFTGVELRTAGQLTTLPNGTVEDTRQSITATSDGGLSSTQGGITVVADDASTFSFTVTAPAGPPYSVPAGGQVSYQLVARDRFGNQDKQYTGTARFSSTDPSAGLPAAYTFNVNDGGQKGFTATLLSSGTQTITATDSIAGAVGTSPAIEVQAAAAGLLNVAGFPTAITAGDTGGFSVTLFDNKGNVATGFRGTVQFASSDPTARFALATDPGTAIGSYTFTAADAGTRQFVAVLTQSGPRTLTVTPVTDPAVNSGTVSTDVRAAAATSFRVGEFRSPTEPGVPGLVRVTALDRFGNTADGYTGLVRLTSSDPAATLPPQSKLTNGTAFFSVALNTPGTQSITASDSSDGSLLGSQTGITVTGRTVPPQPQAPTVSPLGAATVTTGGSTVVPFTVTTFPLGAGADQLVYTATSSDPVLLPPSALVFGGTGGSRTLTATPAAGRTGSATVTVTVFDPTTNLASTRTFGLTVNPVPLPPPPAPGSQTNLFAVGADIGVTNRVTVYNPDGSVLNRLEPFAAGFSNGTRPATVRQADGKQLIAAVPGPGRVTEVRVLDPNTGATVRTLEGFEGTFTGGAFVAAGDVTGDGVDDIAVSPDQGGGGRVRVYDGKTYEQLADFFGIDDPTFRGGARVSFGDLNADGLADLIVAAGFGGGPRVALFDGATVRPGRSPEKFVGDFFLFEPTLRNGVFIAAGDINGDGAAELVAGGGPGGGPRVFALDGKGLLAGQFNPVANFFAGDAEGRGGIRIAVKNLDGDRFADVVAGDGEGAGTTVRTFFGADLVQANNGTPVVGGEFEELPGATNGVFVG